MKLKCLILLTVVAFGAATPMMAEENLSATAENEQIEEADTLSDFLKNYLVLKLRLPENDSLEATIDTVSILYEQHIGVLDYLNDPQTPARWLRTSPEYYRMFVPFTYYETPLAQYSELQWDVPEAEACPAELPVDPLYDDAPFTSYERAQEAMNPALMAAYVKCPRLVVNTEDNLEQVRAFEDDISGEQRSKKSELQQALQADKNTLGQEASVKIEKPNWWTTSGSGSLQMTQNYFSDNWYNGGESTVSALATLQLQANYDDQQRVQWENLLDAKLGFYSTPSDDYHDYLTSSDQIRLYSKLGLQAVKNWYYTLSTELKTQFVNGYESDDPDLISGFLAPLDWSVSLGMDYKRSKDKYTLSVFLAPLTYTLRYVGNEDVDETSYGLDEGKKTSNDFGSEVTVNLTWKITNSLSLESRLDYLTSYNWTRIEWESTANLAVSKYLSAKLYVYARYDDSCTPTTGSSYFQLQELLSFGLSYSW